VNFPHFTAFSDGLLSLVIENYNKITTQQQWHRRSADKLSAAAANRPTKVGGGAHKLLAAAAHDSSQTACHAAFGRVALQDMIY